MNAAKPSIPKGDTNVWITASMVGVTLLMVLAVVGVILVNGLGYFWTSPLVEATLADGTRLLGEVAGHHVRKDGTNRVAETQFNVRNRDCLLYTSDAADE